MQVTKCLYCAGKDLTEVARRADNTGIVRCATCGVMMVDRLNDDTESMYGAEYFEKNADTGYGYTDYLSSPAANLAGKYAFGRLFARQPGRHLDLGCADGSLMEIFASEGFETRGLEISADAAQIAKAKGLDVAVSNLHGSPAKPAPTDVVTAFDLLEHVDNPKQVLQAVYDNLQPGGYLVFSTLSVTKVDASEFWFNNSLEHYMYYDRSSLEYILTDIFGKDAFGFAEITSNGASEFWGFAKKTSKGQDATRESKIIATITTGDYNVKDADDAYLLSLFHDQVANFSASKKIIDSFRDAWPVSRLTEARFFFYFYQGKFEKALQVGHADGKFVPANRVIFWQAVAHAEAVFSNIKQADIVANEAAKLAALKDEMQAAEKDYNEQILELRSNLFKVRDELHTLLNARLLGKIIRGRDVVGGHLDKVRPIFQQSPRTNLVKGAYKTRKAVAKVLPPPFSRAVMRTLRAAKSQVDSRLPDPMRYEVVKNEVWPADRPLVSIVIPYYNRADTIDDTLDSLVVQTFRNFEVIIVDDGSTDEASIQKLKHLTQDVPNLQVHHQKNQGVATARNTGVAMTKGKYVICLDSDDLLDTTFIEKAVLVLEAQPDISLITTHQDMFGVMSELYRKSPYDPLHLYDDNMVITAAAFRREAWTAADGYKPGIGYEDWDFWLSMAEHGFWGKLIPEPLFKYRTSMQSRYVDDKDLHWKNIKTIHSLHPGYKSKVRALLAKRKNIKKVADVSTALVNAGNKKDFITSGNSNKNVLITIPWMTFGGAETLIYNFCREIKADFNISFITGLRSEHEWEYKFREISPNIYHLANLFEDEKLYLEFVSHYIATRQIDVLHIIHNGFTFAMLPELKKRHPQLKVIVTVFNDRAPYCEQSIGYEDYIDTYSADNQLVISKYQDRITAGKPELRLIPNGINAYEEFNLDLFEREAERDALGIADDELAVFFVGRLSEEKNPDVFLHVAGKLCDKKQSKKTRFFVIGDGPMKPEIEKLLKDINNPRVTYLGYQSAVAKYLAAADIFVLPSSVEGFPLSILEAMAMQVVPVASKVGGVPEIIDNGSDGYVVTAGSVDEIAKAIVTLENDPALLKAMKAKARQKIEGKFSNRILGANYRKLYKDTAK